MFSVVIVFRTCSPCCSLVICYFFSLIAFSCESRIQLLKSRGLFQYTFLIFSFCFIFNIKNRCVRFLTFRDYSFSIIIWKNFQSFLVSYLAFAIEAVQWVLVFYSCCSLKVWFSLGSLFHLADSYFLTSEVGSLTC